MMPLYVKDPQVDVLVTRLAGLKRLSKTEVVKRALQHELERESGKPSLVEAGISYLRALRSRSDPAKGEQADKSFIDGLYEER